MSTQRHKPPTKKTTRSPHLQTPKLRQEDSNHKESRTKKRIRKPILTFPGKKRGRQGREGDRKESETGKRGRQKREGILGRMHDNLSRVE